MAGKCAVVATNVGSIPYTIQNAINGFSMAPKDFEGMVSNISNLVENPKLREQMAEEGFKSIQTLTLDSSIEKLDGLFRASFEAR